MLNLKFYTFSTASPRHSIVGLEIPSSALAGLQELAESSGTVSGINSNNETLIAESQSLDFHDSSRTGLFSNEDLAPLSTRHSSAFSAVAAQRQQSSRIFDLQDSQGCESRLPPSSGSLSVKSFDNQPIPSVLF